MKKMTKSIFASLLGLFEGISQSSVDVSFGFYSEAKRGLHINHKYRIMVVSHIRNYQLNNIIVV